MVPGRTKTALITDASSGIGAAFVRKFAEMNYQLILVARRHQRMAELAADVRDHFGVNAEVMVADLSNADQIRCVVERIRERKDLEILVNCAGFGIPGKFLEVSLEQWLSMIEVHILATVTLTQAALPGMVERHQGAVINLSSIGAYIRGPSDTIYCATKSFLNAFSVSLASELSGTGVQVQALRPGFTRTEFHSRPEYARMRIQEMIPHFLWMSPENVVEISLRDLEKGRAISIPGRLNRIMIGLARSRLAAPLWVKLVSRPQGR